MRIPALIILLSLFSSTALPAADTDLAVDQDGERVVSWKRIVPNLWTDQKQIWLFPFHKTERKKWLPVLVVGGITAGLIAADPATARYFRNNSTAFHSFNNALDGRGSEAAIIAAPIALYAAGLVRNDARTRSTAMLAGEAAIDAELVTIALKDITRRRGPSKVTYGQYSNSWLKSEGGYWKGSGSFPSGHTSTAFAVATVFADRYRSHKWVPYVAYGGAALVGLSRITQSAHYMSDVFFGAALGYSISHFSVLRQ